MLAPSSAILILSSISAGDGHHPPVLGPGRVPLQLLVIVEDQHPIVDGHHDDDHDQDVDGVGGAGAGVEVDRLVV